jgi:hypothetical protein
MESMNEDQQTDPAAAASAATQSAKNAATKKADSVGAAVSLSFPSTMADPTPHLAPLRDNHSAYTAVSRSCLLLNQYAGGGSSSAVEDVNSVVSSDLFHDATYAETMSVGFAALMECISTHDDRRAKIIACKTLALVARSTYARIRHSPHLFALRDSTNNRLEDEVGTDAPMALCTVALDDPDDGVAAVAIQSLGILTLSSLARPGTLVEDELMRELLSITQGRPSPYASMMLDALQDEDPTIPQMELQSRIFENVMSPRLLQLVCRVTSFDSVHHIRIILPFLTSCLVHLSKTSPALLYGMDRATYSKRWVELDFVSLVNDVVEVILLPAMRSSFDGHLAHAAALSSIRLVHACPHAPWAQDVCEWAILVLKEEMACVDSLEAQLSALAALTICARAIPLPARSSTLEFVFEHVQRLPSTTLAPHGIHSPGLLVESNGILHYRRPARVAFLTDIALSFFVDGPVESREHQVRSTALQEFFKSAIVTGAMKEERSTKVVTQVREELIATFCMVAADVGRNMRLTPEGGGKSAEGAQLLVCGTIANFEEWIRMSLAVLTKFSPCIGWGQPPAYMEEELSLLVAAQSSYVRLVQEVLHSVGLLSSMSVSLKMAPTASPPNMLWDQMEESAMFLGNYDASSPSDVLLDSIAALIDELVKQELKGQGIVSHHMRLFLLSLAADQWVQGRHLATRKEFEATAATTEGSQLNLNVNSARELLVALSPRRVFSKVVESHKAQIELYGKKKKELYKKYAQDTVTVCVACIENIALTACSWRKRFGVSQETKHILNLSIASLQGKNISDNDADAQAPVLPVCQAAIERIQTAFANNEGGALSPLLAGAGDLKRRPVVTAARSQQGRDSYNEGYLMQLSRQIIATRIDRCLLSVPPIYSFRAAARKQNWLRLAVPPLPASRNPQVPVSQFPRFQWGSNISSMAGGSDAAALTMAYSIRRSLRYDGEDEFRLMVVMRVHNTTAVEITEGVRLELSVVQENATTSTDSEDQTSVEVMKALGGGDEFSGEASLASAITVYKNELKCGEHLTWQVMLESLPMTGAISLHPSIVYRLIEVEPTNATWVGGDAKEASQGCSTLDANAKGGNPDDDEAKTDEEDKENVEIPGEPMLLSPLVGLQPCPLVFFRDGSGDVDSFRFLWSRMPCQIPPLRVAPMSSSSEVFHHINGSSDAMRLAAVSTLRFSGEPIPGGFVTRLWAFMSLQGKRVLCVMAESDVDTGNYGTNDKTMHVRGDDANLLCCLAATATSRGAFVAALAPGFYPL